MSGLRIDFDVYSMLSIKPILRLVRYLGCMVFMLRTEALLIPGH